MEIAIKFTPNELLTIARALTFGIVHTSNAIENQLMKELDRKIKLCLTVSTLS